MMNWQVSKAAVKTWPDIKKVMAELKQVTIALEKLRTVIVRAERMFGLGPDDEIVSCVYNIKSGDIQKVLDELQVIRSNYWEIMVPMHRLFNSIFERFTALYDAVELFEKEYSTPLFHKL
jgi:hypothetical protein